jgi:hypothetical protein
MVEPENRVALVIQQNMMNVISKRNLRSGVVSVFEADEDTLPFYMGYKMHIALKDVMNLKMSQLHESGIPQQLLGLVAMESFRTKPEEIGPQVLSLAHLKAGFIVIFALLFLSVSVFLVECGPKLVKKLFYWCLPCYIVVKFTRMNRVL